jgi:hypothetical protein
MKPESVPFGKYKDQPIETLLADQSYLDWIASQPEIIAWLQANHPDLFTVISRRTDQDSGA